jgi:YesN/AraC family two-component response regulator
MAARKKVLFVDDEPSIRVTLPAILERNGFEVTAVASVTEAIAAISHAQFDVLLSDLNIGEPGDGFTVVSAMRRVQPQARAFIITGYPDFESALRAIRNQVDDYFVKPTDATALVAMLQQKLLEPKQTQYGPLKQVSQVLQELQPVVIRVFAEVVPSHPELRHVKLQEEKIADHVPAVLVELTSRVRSGATKLRPETQAAAVAYGTRRHEQGYSVAMLVTECHLLEHVISATLQDNLLRIEMSTLIRDMIGIGESLNAFTEEAVRAFSHASLPHTA